MAAELSNQLIDSGAESGAAAARKEKIPVGVSACLLGERVRYDGGHKRDAHIVETLGEHFDWHPFCPEFEIGLGVPRKPIRLVAGEGGAIRCVQLDDPRIEHTRALADCLAARREQVAALCACILKKNSPSCGPSGVPVWRGEAQAAEGSGIFASALMKAFPWMPVADERELASPTARANFIQRVFVLRRWRGLMRENPGIAALTRFHARHKLMIMSHDPASYPKLGRLLAEARGDDLATIAERYLRGLMAALKQPADRGRQTNTLLHVLGHLKGKITPAQRRDLRRTIDDFHQGRLPLAAAVEHLNRHFRQHPDPYIADSWHMNPEPAERALGMLAGDAAACEAQAG